MNKKALQFVVLMIASMVVLVSTKSESLGEQDWIKLADEQKLEGGNIDDL